MGIFAIVLGLFLLFAIAFNGGLGAVFYSLAATTSAVCLISVGITAIKNKENKTAPFYLSIVAFISYLAVIFQLFTFTGGVEWLALFFNTFILFYIGLLINYYKPNKAIKKDV